MRKRLKSLRNIKFTKYDEIKSRLDLLPPRAIEIIGFVLRSGALKYAPDNWRECKDPSRFVRPLLGHTLSHMRGEFTDPESGLPSLAHAICSGLFALDLYLNGAQDRFTMGNYFTIIRKSGKRGVVTKRFRSYTAAWDYLEKNKLDPDKFTIKTLPSNIKVGSRTKC